MQVNWVPGFYSRPTSAPLARTDAYKKGDIYGIDISSGYAVTLLDIQPGGKNTHTQTHTHTWCLNSFLDC